MAASHGSECVVYVRRPARGDTFGLAPIEDQESCAAPAGASLVVGILPAVDTAGYKPFAAPRLHRKTRIPPSEDLPPGLGCTPATILWNERIDDADRESYLSLKRLAGWHERRNGREDTRGENDFDIHIPASVRFAL